MASMMPLAILVWNQRRMPLQWRLAIIGGRRLWVAHQYHFLRERLGVIGGLDVELLEGEAREGLKSAHLARCGASRRSSPF
jgi:hypothetical protein